MLGIQSPNSTTFHCKQMKPGQDGNRPFVLKISDPKMSDHKEAIQWKGAQCKVMQKWQISLPSLALPSTNLLSSKWGGASDT